MGFATTPPKLTPNETPKVRVISLAPWGVRSSRFLLLRGHGPLLKGTNKVENGPQFLGPCIAVGVVNFGHLGVPSPLGNPTAPGRSGILGSQDT